jgi:hypothetical protein
VFGRAAPPPGHRQITGMPPVHGLVVLHNSLPVLFAESGTGCSHSRIEHQDFLGHACRDTLLPRIEGDFLGCR